MPTPEYKWELLNNKISTVKYKYELLNINVNLE